MRSRAIFCLSMFLLFPCLCAAQPANRVTILYDAFGKPSPTKLIKDWGFSALVEYGGKRILFDTGNNAEIFAHNVNALRVDLKKLDFVVISHRHGDHTSGLNYLLRINPNLTIYTPRELFGLFGGSVSKSFYRTNESLPSYMRYFDGTPRDTFPTGTPWQGAQFAQVETLTEIAPGIFLIPTVSKTPGTLELPELTLAIRTPKGLILVDGCSHAGIETVLEAATAVDKHIYLLLGGLHLVSTPDPEITRIATVLRDKWKIDRIAAGHCTGEPAFAALAKTFGEQNLYAGLGATVRLP